MLKVNSIKWHRECLNNNRRHVNNLIDERNKLNDKIAKDLEQLAKYEKQILAAEQSGKDTFDKEKYLKSKH